MIRASLLCVAALLTLGSGSALAAFPGRPGPIAYERTKIRDLGGGENFYDGGITSRSATRGARRRQLTVSISDGEPSYSANGRRLIYTSFSERSELNGIYHVNFRGRQKRETRALGDSPSYFPSGRRILFARKDEDGFSHIYSARANGTRIRQLTFGPFHDSEPAVSPSGRRVLFVSDRNGAAGGTDIYTMRANGSGIGVLIAGAGTEAGPDFAPGGNRIAFSSSRGRGPSNIFVARADGSGVRRLTRCVSVPGCPAYSHPSFSPRGRRIAVLSSTASSSAIVVIRSDRRRPPLITVDSGSVDEAGAGIVLGPPAWGPRPR